MKIDALLPLRLALLELRQGWRHFSIVLICLVLGVTVMAGVGSLSAMVQSGLGREAQSLLGGDVEVSIRGMPATAEQVSFLKNFGTLSYVSTLRSMAHHKNRHVLVELKAVDDAYPLLGSLSINATEPAGKIMARGGLLVDSILPSQLGILPGEQIQLGNATFPVAATIESEPDRAVQIFSFGPRVMLSHAALEQSGLSGPFSLVEHRYRLKLAQPDATIGDKLKSELAARFPGVSWRVQTGTDGNRTLERFLDQLLGFLMLSGLATFLIAGIGIGSSVRAYLDRKAETIAVMKILGASRAQVLAWFAWVLGLIGLMGGIVGVVIAFGVIASLLPMLSGVLPMLKSVSFWQPAAWLTSIWYGLLIAYLFSMPALLSALDIRPARLFRIHSGALPIVLTARAAALMAALSALLAATLILTALDRMFMAGALAMMLLIFAVFAFCAWAVRNIARRLSSRPFWLRLALSNLYRPGATSGTVIFAMGISLTLLITLALTEANLQSRITKVATEEAPSLFLMDIQSDEQPGIASMLQSTHGARRVMVYPMVRGRIEAINGKAVKESDVDEDVRWAVRGDRGLSYSATPPENAMIEEGEWWPAGYRGTPLISVDKQFLSGMKLKLGDTLTLNILGQSVTARIANARDIDYTSFQINFAMMLSPGVIDDFPKTHLATVHLSDPEEEVALVDRIAQAYPGVTVIRTAEVVALVRRVLGHISTALTLTVIVSLCAGLLVLASALTASIEQRLYDTAILKVLGARQRDIWRVAMAEWTILAGATSVLAVLLGTLSSYLVTIRFRDTEFSPMPQVILLIVLGCFALIALTGTLGNRRLFRFKPSAMLRNE